MNIIRFPGMNTRIKKAKTSVEPVSKLIIGPFSFTCTNCGETCNADFKNMIFKSIDFHCNSCGTFFKVANPAFTVKPK